MNNVDKQYLDIVRDILDKGTKKQTRAGEVLSVFDRTMRFDLKDGLPLLTTKKVFTKGCIFELLWFLSGNTNIKYLLENNVNIWTDDAYRYYKELCEKHNINAAYLTVKIVNKEEFIKKTLNGDTEEFILVIDEDDVYKEKLIKYHFGDLGDVYGKQWRRFGISQFDQIQHIVEMLLTNPDDRRMLCVAFNPDVLYSAESCALPPCHVMFQFYTRELTHQERLDWYNKNYIENINNDNLYSVVLEESESDESLDELNVPKRELSLSFWCRSQDFPLGTPFNILSYSLLTYMMCKIVNMVPGELIYHGGDCHIYTNQIEGIKEQLKRNGSDKLPKLKFTEGKEFKNITDFVYEDFIIENYYPDPVIKFPLSVG